MTPETMKILVDGIWRIIIAGGVVLCIYTLIKGAHGGYDRGG